MDPFFISVTASLVGKGVGSLYDAVRARFKGDPSAIEQLDSIATGIADTQDIERFSRLLEATALVQPQFRDELELTYSPSNVAVGEDETVNNLVSGNISGKVIQARDIEGDISM